MRAEHAGLPVTGLAVMPAWETFREGNRHRKRGGAPLENLIICCRGSYIIFYDCDSMTEVYSRKTKSETSISGLKVFDGYLAVWSDKEVFNFKFGNVHPSWLVPARGREYPSEVCAFSENHAFLRNNSIVPDLSEAEHRLLYSACFAMFESRLVALSGTIFNTVEARFVGDSDNFAVAKGHTGSIFCLIASEQFVFSGSDDRTIRQWKTSGGLESVKIYLGHTARIWSLDYNESGLLASGGENEVCLWNYKLEAGNMPLRMIKNDSMGAVWHVVLTGESFICGHQTGAVSKRRTKCSQPDEMDSTGASGSVYRSEASVLTEIEESIVKVLTLTYGTRDGNLIERIYIAESGSIYQGTSKANVLPLNRHHFVAANRHLVLVAENETRHENGESIQRNSCIFRLLCLSKSTKQKRRLESIKFPSNRLMSHAKVLIPVKISDEVLNRRHGWIEFICVTDDLRMWLILVDHEERTHPDITVTDLHVSLRKAKNPMPTAALWLQNDFLAVGTCQGYLYVFWGFQRKESEGTKPTPRKNSKVLAHSGKNGRNGVASILYDGDHIITCGNDGTIKKWEMDDGQLRQTSSIRLKIESPIAFLERVEEIIYFGHTGADFVLFQGDHELFRCNTGGRHRQASFVYSTANDRPHSLVYLNKGRVHLLELAAESIETKTVDGCGHFGLINSIEVRPWKNDWKLQPLKVTTSDDCSIRIGKTKFPRPVTMCGSATINVAGNALHYLVAGFGSKGHVSVFTYKRRDGIDIIVELLPKLPSFQEAKKRKHEDTLGKITCGAFWVADKKTFLIVFSSTQQATVYNVDIDNRFFEEYFSFDLNGSHCPLSVAVYNNQRLAMTDSGGFFKVYFLKELEEKISNSSDHRVDDAAIQTFSTTNGKSFVLGGDAGKLLIVEPQPELKIKELPLSACGIVRLRFRRNQLWALTIDQRIHHYDEHLKFVEAFYTHVADPSDFAFDSECSLCIVGQGMQTIRF